MRTTKGMDGMHSHAERLRLMELACFKADRCSGVVGRHNIDKALLCSCHMCVCVCVCVCVFLCV